jgi:hypothetical protein
MPKLARWLLPATLVALLVGVSSAHAAATFTVNTTADNAPSAGECSGGAGDCSLRQAIDAAQNGDTIVVPASGTPYSVSAGEIALTRGVTIQGAGAATTTVSGGGTSQIFDVQTGSAVTIKSLTLTNGFHSGSDASGTIDGTGGNVNLTLDSVVISHGQTDGGFGGAMELGGTVHIVNSRFADNSASGVSPGTGAGGAIDFFGPSTVTITNSVFDHNTHTGGHGGGAVLFEDNGTATINSSTFSANSANSGPNGGALDFLTGTSATIENSTFSGNSAAATGGAIHFPSDATSLTLVNDTFAGNSAPAGANIDDAGPTSAKNTIFAAPGGGGTSCSTPLATIGHDLDDSSDNSCLLSPSQGDLIGVSPALGALADNSSQVPTPGGPPQTMALPATSPAVGAGDATACGTVGNVDERGFPRPGIPSTGCDIGAYETYAQVGTSTSASSSNASPAFHQPVTITAAIGAAHSVPSAVPSPSGTVTFKEGASVLGSSTVTTNHASLTTATLSPGTHTITATYSGDGVYGGSTSAPVTVTVKPPRPSISRLRESHKKWRLGSKHARLSKRGTPVGTVFRFKLNTPSTVRLTFRRVVGHKKRAAGSLSFKHTRAGTRKLAFQGRLKGRRKLKPGRYTVTFTASNATGHTSRTLKFTIVKH